MRKTKKDVIKIFSYSKKATSYHISNVKWGGSWEKIKPIPKKLSKTERIYGVKPANRICK